MAGRKKDTRGYLRAAGTYLGKHYDIRAKSKPELDEKLRAKRKEIESGSRLIDKHITVAQWGEHWLATYKQDVTDVTRRQIAMKLKNYIYPTIGMMPVSQVRPINCQAVINSAAHLAPSTIKWLRAYLNELFKAAKKNGLCRDNPAEDLPIPRNKKPVERRSLTDRERLILLETCKTHPLGLWVQFQLYTGLRPAESFALTFGDIQNGWITVSKAVDGQGNIKTPKTINGFRKVPVTAALAAILPTGAPDEYVFTRRCGKPFNRHHTSRLFESFRAAMEETEQAMIAAGQLSPLKEALPPLIPYDLRHTFCTDMERAGVPINVASRIMGHSNISITAKVYTHTSDDVISQARDALNAFSPNVSPTTPRNKTLQNAQFPLNIEIFKKA